MAALPGGVQVGGFIAPTDDTDIYAVIDNVYGVGGLREVADADARDLITVQRRRAGMVVTTQNDLLSWQLLPDLVTWRPFGGGGGSSSLWRIPFVEASQLDIPGLTDVPNVSVWLDDEELLGFTFNTYQFGGSTFNQISQPVRKLTNDYEAIHYPASNSLKITFIGPKSGTVVYAV